MKRAEIECTKDLSAKPKNNNYNRVLLQPLDQITTVHVRPTEKKREGRGGRGGARAELGRLWEGAAG